MICLKEFNNFMIRLFIKLYFFILFVIYVGKDKMIVFVEVYVESVNIVRLIFMEIIFG